MALRSYGVLKGKAIEVKVGAGQSPHYQVRIIDDTTDYRIAINVKSQLPPSDVEFVIIERFQHPITDVLEPLRKGFTSARAKAGNRRRSTSSGATCSTAARCGRCRSACQGSTTI